MKVNKYRFDSSQAILAANVLKEFCDKTPCQKCPFYSAHDCTLRSSAPDAWTAEDWRSPEEDFRNLLYCEREFRNIIDDDEEEEE